MYARAFEVHLFGFKGFVWGALKPGRAELTVEGATAKCGWGVKSVA
jgi:hypothetical protein